MVGSTSELGKWDPLCGLKLNWGPFHVWTGILKYREIPFEYKYVCLSGSEVIWEKGKNRLFDHYESEKIDNWQDI